MASAAERHLERIIQAERQRGVRWLCAIRALGSTALTSVWIAEAFTGASPVWGQTLPLIGVTEVIGLALWIAARRRPDLSGLLSFSIAALDVPVGTLVTLKLGGLESPATHLVPTITFLCTEIAVSSITLSKQAVLATYFAALAGGALLYADAGTGLSVQLAALIPAGASALTSLFVVTRVRTLVAESRRDDLVGKYILGARLGAGGMAEVFKATYSPEGGFERPVAVKRVLPHLAADAQFIDRFRREAELTARLVHPNVVQVLDFGRHRDSYFLAMEFVDGVTLSRLVDLELPLAAVSYIGLQVAEALEFIHSRVDATGSPLRLVHRDLNPPNILISKLGEVKVADFGVARVEDGRHLTESGAVVGKLGYLSPEQAQGAAYDARADLFALGVTLYELLAAARAYQGQSDVEIMRTLLSGRLPPLATRRGQPLPKDLEAAVMGLVEREVGARTATATQVKVQLLALAGEAAPLPDGQRLLAAAVARLMEAPALGPAPPMAEAARASLEEPTRETPRSEEVTRR